MKMRSLLERWCDKMKPHTNNVIWTVPRKGQVAPLF